MLTRVDEENPYAPPSTTALPLVAPASKREIATASRHLVLGFLLANGLIVGTIYAPPEIIVVNTAELGGLYAFERLVVLVLVTRLSRTLGDIWPIALLFGVGAVLPLIGLLSVLSVLVVAFLRIRRADEPGGLD